LNRGADPRPSRKLSLTLPILVLVLAFTALPADLRPPSGEWPPLTSPSLDVYDIVANVAGYVPVGAVLAARTIWASAAVAAAVSGFAEVTQLFTPGREPSLLDLATNIIGALLGWGAARRWSILPSRIDITRSSAIQAAILALVCGLLVSRVTPLEFENAVGALARTVPVAWLPANERGATVPGKLEAHWTFNGDSAQLDGKPGARAVDVSGNGVDGVLVNGPTFAPGIDGPALRVNGLNQFAEFPQPVSLRLSGSMTIDAWINASSFPSSDAAIVSSRGSRGFQLDTTVDRGPRTLAFRFTNRWGQLTSRYGATPLRANTWYHVAGVFDARARTLIVYLNGQPDNGCVAGTVTDRQTVSSDNVYVGRAARPAGFEFAGSIDDVRIYSRALSQDEIRADMTAASTPAEARKTLRLDSSDNVCPSLEPADARSGGMLVAVGVLIAIACAGLWPMRHYRAVALVSSTVAGVLLIPSVSSLVVGHYAWFVPALTLVGGAAGAASLESVRSDRT
jgi:VanZ family protein